MTHPDHRHIPFPLDKITGITADLAPRGSVLTIRQARGARFGQSGPVSNASDGLTEGRGRWVLPIRGGEVTQVRIDFAFGLVVETYGDDPASVSIRISTPFSFERDGRTILIDPERTADLGPLVTLHKAEVQEAHAVKDGHLLLRLADGRAIEVAPHEQYEAWQADGHLPPIERKFSLVAIPSGGLARF